MNSYAPKSLRNTDGFSEFLKYSIDCNVFGVELSTVYVSERVQIPAARFSETATKTMNPHSAIDARSLDMDRLIAQRLRENPAVLDKARSVLAKWMTSCDASVRPVFEEWRAILDGPISGVFSVLEGVDERSMRLRQSSPFCGILTPAERTAILMSHWRKQRTSRLMPLPLEHLTENTEHAV